MIVTHRMLVLPPRSPSMVTITTEDVGAGIPETTIVLELPGFAAYDSRLKVGPTLLDGSAPCAPLAPLKSQPRPQQPHAAPHQLGIQRRPMESGRKVRSK